MPTPRTDRLLRLAGIAMIGALAAFGLARPASLLAGGAAWLVALAAAASGWGYLALRAQRAADVDLGLRIAWGLAAYLGVAGVLIAFGLCTRPVLLVLVAGGLAGFAWRELVTPTPTWAHARAGFGWARAHPGPALGLLVLGAFAAFHIASAVATLDRNPWDDDLAYTPFVKRLLDRGDLIEPFSFRRLSTYGGQAALAALTGARGTLANVQALDAGLCFGTTLLLLVGFARERRTNPAWTALLAAVLLVLPPTAINTAPQWSGVVMFVALYRSVVRARWQLVGLVAAATCTLRQNYLAVVVLFVAFVLLARLVDARRRGTWRDAWRAERAIWLAVVGVGLAALAMWCVAAIRSSDTFLYPLVGGTWNPSLSLAPAVTTWVDDVTYLVWAALDATPFAIMPILFAVLASTRDPRIGRPLTMLWLAAMLGLALVVHGFVGTEPSHAWRYAFGFATALALVLVVEVGAEDHIEPDHVQLGALGRWVLLAALALQALVARGSLTKRLATEAAALREAATMSAHGDPTAVAEAARYAAMQAAIPAGAHVAVMLDDPAYLDFARNAIANLDTPGFASPSPGLPTFRGAEPIRRYFVDRGDRFVAFVRSERSRYFFRRGFWIWRYFNDGELFQAMSAHTLDLIDAFTELATTVRVVYDRDGLVVLDLGTPLRAATTLAGDAREAVRRDAWMKRLAEREGLAAAWSLTTRHDLRFEDGVAGLQIVDEPVDPAWFEPPPAPSPPWTPAGPAPRGTPIRPLFRRAHLRVRGDTAMHLELAGALALNTVHTQPRLDVSFDGELVASAIVDAAGRFDVALDLAGDRVRGGWHDVYLVWSSVSEPGADERDPRVARLERVIWTAAP